jgi:predicted ArsR family transcriptional regulator
MNRWDELLSELHFVPQTAAEAARNLEQSTSTVRWRISKLVSQGLVRDSGVRRVNAVTGKKVTVWEVIDG